jgi:fimbrial chaperone protein
MKPLTCAALAAILFAPAAAHASAVVIWPIDPVIGAKEQATTLWLENKGDTAVTLQVRTFAWSQPGGVDALTAQDEVVASPPIAEVAPGKRQLVRIIRRAAPAAGTPERAYRLFIDELPAAPDAAAVTKPAARLSVQMRYSIPLFAYAADPAPPVLDVVQQGGDLVLHNTGARHARLTDLRIVGPDGRATVVRPGLAGYVLPGATVRFAIPTQPRGAVHAGVDGTDRVLAPSI